ncbi:MAG: hypothetical protein H0U33_06325 [Solirubrobacterales bacterium]|nr:hypothetical protein [Solirubrobacterales bacterium]
MTYRTLTGHVRAFAVIGLTLTALMAPAAAHACEQSDEGERYEARSGLAFSGDDREIRRTTVVLAAAAPW